MSGGSTFPFVPPPEFFPRPEDLPPMEPVAAMTLRVSHDSGRTWGPRRDVRGTDPFVTAVWPPCKCPRCRT